MCIHHSIKCLFFQIKQLKKLKAKQKLLTKKLTGTAEGLDSEEERLLSGGTLFVR